LNSNSTQTQLYLTIFAAQRAELLNTYIVVVRQDQQLINDKYNEKDKIQNRPTHHAVQTKIHNTIALYE